MRWSLRSKLVVSYLAIIAAVLAAGMIYVHWGLSYQLLSQTVAGLTREARLARQNLVTVINTTDQSQIDSQVDKISRALGVRVTVIARDGTLLGDSDLRPQELRRAENHATRPEVIEALKKGVGTDVRHSRTVDRDLLYLALPIREGLLSGGVLRLAVGLGEVKRTVAQMRHLLLTAGALALLLALAFSTGAGVLVQRAFAELLEAVDRISRGEFTERIGSLRRDELGALSGAIDRLAEEVESRLRELRVERDRLDAILRGMTEGVMVTDDEGGILLVNPALRAFFPTLPEFRGAERLPLEVLRASTVQEVVREALSSGDGRLTREVETLGPPPRTLTLNAAKFGVGDEARLVLVFHDVTELKRLEAVRRDFTANVSHELRTPLTAIRAAAETLETAAAGDPEAVRRFAGAITRHTIRLTALVEDLLELGRIESKQDHVQPDSVSLAEVMTAVKRVLDPAFESRRITLEEDIPAEADRLWADAAALERILINLIENAVSYSPEESTVRLSARPRADGKVDVMVQDQGEGIPPEHITRIFERFYRVDPARSRERGGTGLGLAIVKHLVQSLGGRVEVESTPGRGSTFTVVLRKA